MKKVLITATVQSHIAQFHKPLINMLKEIGYVVHVAARDNLVEKNGLQLNEPDKIFDIPFNRSPVNKNNIKAYKELSRILSEEDYDIVHCNTPMGGMITRLAVQRYRKNGTKIFYTAHGFHFYKGSPAKNWFIYYPIEKWFAKITDKLITITMEDYELANHKFNTEVIHVHGVGANSNRYYPYSAKCKMNLRKQYGYKEDQLLILCTGELNKNKNQDTIINAIAEVTKSITNVKLLIAGNGPREYDLKNLVKSLNIEEHVDFLGYCTDLEKYVNISDIVVSASFREGLPLNIMEAMLCGKPVVVSNNRGHNELIIEGETGFIVRPTDSSQFSIKICELLEDNTLRRKFGAKAMINIRSYNENVVLEELKSIYQS